jgi:hypothetical protein
MAGVRVDRDLLVRDYLPSGRARHPRRCSAGGTGRARLDRPAGPCPRGRGPRLSRHR